MSRTDTATACYSIDGRTFAFRGPVAAGIRPGAYVLVATRDGTRRLGQVLEVHAEPGATFAEPSIQGSGALLSAAGDEPFTNATVSVADHVSVEARLAGESTSGDLHIGGLVDVSGVPAVLRATGFTRHTFMCGQSGSGKTYAMGVVLERILHETSLRIVVLDPNSDYVRIGTLRPQHETGHDDESYTRTRHRHDQVAEGIQVFTHEAGGMRLWLGNLTPLQRDTILGLDPITDADEVDVASRVTEDLGTRFSPADLRHRAMALDEPAARRLALRIGNLGLDRMGIWADEQHPAIVDRLAEDWRAIVFDLGSLHDPRERSIVSAAVVAALWERRRERRPVLFVIDEAHNVCPQRPSDPNQALATEQLIAIAGEGRKYGIYLVLSTQRPTKIHDNVLSQCDNLMLMRMNSAADVAHLVATFSAVPHALIERSTTFRLGEGLAAGRIAPDSVLFKTGLRITPEGGSDIPTDWARRPEQ